MLKVIAGKNQIRRLAQVRQRIKMLEEVEAELVEQAIAHIKQYGSLKEGEWSAVIHTQESVRPKWKEEFIKELGQTKADEVIANTKPTISTRVEVYKNGVRVDA